jgi:hypothetical protein
MPCALGVLFAHHRGAIMDDGALWIRKRHRAMLPLGSTS